MAMPDPASVNSLFGRIAARYDIANRLLSGGRDVGWRRELVAAVRRREPLDVLDLATGSGDVAFALSRSLPAAVRITGADFCAPMLVEAERKKAAGAHCANVHFQLGDALNLPFPDASFDAATIAFGLRNLADRARGLAEIRRVLRPGGRLFVLEFSQPRRGFRPFYLFYLRRILPVFAGLVTGDRPAYVYLNESIEKFPGREALAEEIAAAGFSGITARPLTLGIVALHEGMKA
jgi:demethylmenaquinone methyltransferase/2-methoxy-6-polyprenyl-1,4-benzoquinol methylase